MMMGYEKSMMMGQKPDMPGLYKNSWEVWMFIPLNMAINVFNGKKPEFIIKHRD
jgi:hypothetical protein